MLLYYFYIPEYDIIRNVYFIKLAFFVLFVSMNILLFPYFFTLAFSINKGKQKNTAKKDFIGKQRITAYTVLALSVVIALLIGMQFCRIISKRS